MLRARPGFLGLLTFTSFSNFILNLSSVLLGPLLLAAFSALFYGTVQSICGVALIAGSVVASMIRVPRSGVRVIFIATSIAATGLILAGLFNRWETVALSFAVILVPLPIAAGQFSTLLQSTFEQGFQGRIAALRSMLSKGATLLGYVVAGPLADRVLSPAMLSDGLLASSIFAKVVGTGPGRGIGLLYVFCGIAWQFATLSAIASKRVRLVRPTQNLS